jgi:uncharacterized membrane protein YoaK (UPF0700 family)
VTDVGRISNSSTLRTPVIQGLRQACYDEPHGPLPALLLALTMLAGVVDATSILRIGHVFVATMTGNLVFLGLALAGAKGFAVRTLALALGGFLIGVLIGGQLCDASSSHRGRAFRNVMAVKVMLASAVTLIAVLTGPRFPTGGIDAMVVLMAMSMGNQLAAIRFLKVPDLLTVVLTMTIIGVLTERKRGWHDPAVLRRGLSLVAFAFGALSGALLILRVGVTAALLFGLAIIITTTIAAHRASRASEAWTAPR